MASSWTPGFDSMPIGMGPILVRNPPTRPDAKGRLLNGANGFLELNGERVGLWVNDISSSFELSGSASQGATHREFYAHNFTQPSVVVSGQTPNSFQYNRLAEFVRKSQLTSLDLGTASTPLRLIVLTGNVPVPKRNLRGPHSSIWLDGFIPKIEAGAERFVTAHEYSFEFVILAAHSMLPSLSDRIIVPFQLQQTWGVSDAIGERIRGGRKRVNPTGRESLSDNREATSTSPSYLGPTPVYENPDWYDHIPKNKR